MKKTTLALTIIFVLYALLMVGVQSVVEANPGPLVPSLRVLYPYPS